MFSFSMICRRGFLIVYVTILWIYFSNEFFALLSYSVVANFFSEPFREGRPSGPLRPSHSRILWTSAFLYLMMFARINRLVFGFTVSSETTFYLFRIWTRRCQATDACILRHGRTAGVTRARTLLSFGLFRVGRPSGPP